MKPEQIAGTSEHSQQTLFQIKSAPIPLKPIKLTESQKTENARKKRIEKGLCRDCGVRPPKENSKSCQHCFDVRQKATAEYKKKQIANGICVRCGKPNDREKVVLCTECNELAIEQFRQRRKINKLKVIEYFGGKCKQCGESDIRTLTLDHINNDGKNDCADKNGKRIISPTWYAKLIKQIDKNEVPENHLMLLCFNCHAKKDLKPWWFDGE